MKALALSLAQAQLFEAPDAYSEVLYERSGLSVADTHFISPGYFLVFVFFQ